MGVSPDRTVVPFLPRRRLHPDDVVVLTLYGRRRSALGRRARESLAIAEALLFQEGAFAAREAIAAYPADVPFVTEFGTIFHSYCAALDRFTLCDFELPPEGCGLDLHRSAVVARCAGAWASGARAARSAAAFLLAATCAAVTNGLSAVAGPSMTFLLGGPVRTASRARRVAMVPTLMLGREFAVGEDDECGWPLVASHAGEWSLLGGLASVAEELESPFSRLILRGEYLSHLGYAVECGRSTAAWRGALWPHSRYRSDRRRLFEECSLLITALARGDRLDRPARMFLTGDFAIRDLAADERLLSLARCEMVMRVSSSVYVDACAPEDGGPGDIGSHAGRDVVSARFRSFSLLAELAALSPSYFDGPAPSAVASAVIADYGTRRGARRRLDDIVFGIASYDDWLSATGLDVEERPAAGRIPAHRFEAGERLRTILAELLGLGAVVSGPTAAPPP